HQGLWVPAYVRHDIETAGAVWLRAVYLHHSLRHGLPEVCRLVEIGPLLRELLRRTFRLETLDRRTGVERHLLALILNELALLPAAPIDLPMPKDPRAQRAAASVRAEPSGAHSLAGVARHAGASSRTLERLFR